VQRKAHKRNRTTEGSVKLCQEGIERVQRVHQRTPFRVPRKGKCQGEGTYRVTEHSVKKGSTRCASSRRTPGGREAFLCKKYFELSYPKTQQHKECANKNLSEVLKLRRNSARSALRVNLSQVQKLEKEQCLCA
jgi:hypothetical protein